MNLTHEGAETGSRTPPVFLSEGGELGDLIRTFDWAGTELGSVENWPQALKTLVAVMLSAHQPMFVAWGARQTLLYNDRYVPILGRKHPNALGRPLLEVWAEIIENIQPLVEQVYAGQPVHMDEIGLTLDRHSHPEEAHFAFSYTPIHDERGNVAGLLCVCTETTEQVRAQRRLLAERERQKHLLRQLPGFVGVVSGRNHVYEYVNDAYVKIAGEREFIGRPVREVLPELEGQGFFELLDSVFSTGQSFIARAMPLRLVGETQLRYIDFIYEPIRNESGQVAGIFVGGYEVTEAHQATQALRATQARLLDLNAELERKVVERSAVGGRFWQISPDLLGVLRPDGCFESVNPAWSVKLGWSEEEVCNRPLFELIHPEDQELSRERFNYLKQGNAILRFENRQRAKDGSYRWFAWAAAPFGEAYYCSGREITAEKEQAVKLAQLRAEHDRVWNNTRDINVIIGPDGIFQAVSPAWKALLGHDPREVVGRSFLDFIWPEDGGRTQGALDSALSDQNLTNFENRYRHKDGSSRWISWNTSVEQGVVYAFGREITATKEAEAQLAQTQEALRQAQKMEAVGQLTGGIAHDFNNLLAGITGSLEFVERRLADGRTVGLERFIDAAQGSARRAAALTQRLLAFSRRQTLDPKLINVNRLVAGMEELIRRTVGPSVHLEVVGAGGLWTVQADAPQLESALLNLCINARDAMPEGGRLTIETANKWLDDRAAKQRELNPGQYVSLCVTDTGTGMSEDVIARAFDPFFTTKPIGKGTGLGLSMIHGFVRQSGGQVRIYSEVAHGTTMCLYFPRCLGDAPESTSPDRRSGLSEGSGETVLVIDDEPSVRMLVVEVLDEAGYCAIEAADGPSGLKILQSDARIDLLITDVGLPGGLNGRQVADAARLNRPKLKVLFITGYAENAVVGHGHLEPGMHVITKPFAMDTLGAKIREMLEDDAKVL